MMIEYDFIRLPKIKTYNIFAYAAELKIIFDNQVFLEVDDIAICDLIIELSKWLKDMNKDFSYVPQDFTEEILRFKIDNQHYIITSIWSTNEVKINRGVLDMYIIDFIENFKIRNTILRHLV